VVIDRDIAANPLVGGMLAAEFIELAGAADPVDGGVEPKGHQDFGINGRTPGMPRHGLDEVVEGTEIRSLDIIPDDPRRMVRRNQYVDRRGPEDDLVAVGGAEPRTAVEDRGLGGGGRPSVISRRLEERGLFGTRRVVIAGSVHGDTISGKS
jgi:hypothetical protein